MFFSCFSFIYTHCIVYKGTDVLKNSYIVDFFSINCLGVLTAFECL